MISKEKKTAIMKEYARTEGDTGSPEVQVAILTARIQELTEHLKEHHKGSPFQKGTSEDGWTEKRSAGLPEKERYREIPCVNREIRSEKIIARYMAEGGLL